jgi:hypothetical protein
MTTDDIAGAAWGVFAAQGGELAYQAHSEVSSAESIVLWRLRLGCRLGVNRKRNSLSSWIGRRCEGLRGLEAACHAFVAGDPACRTIRSASLEAFPLSFRRR